MLKYGWIGKPTWWIPHTGGENSLPFLRWRTWVKLAKKIGASFSIPVVRCETFLGQEYSMPPPAKCLTRGRFIPYDPSYQDIQQQPLLMMVAYTQTLQYWVEQAKSPGHLDYSPLVMSIVELMQQMRGHITFYKLDILWNLDRDAPETADIDPTIPQGYPIAQPTPINAQRAHDTTPSLAKEEAPPQPSWFPCPPWSMLTLCHLAQQMLLAPLEWWPKLFPPWNQWSSWQAHLIPSDQTKSKRWYVLIVTALARRLKSGNNQDYSQRNCDCLGRRIGLWETLNGGISSWTHQGKEGDGTPKCHHEGSNREGPGKRLTVENIMDLPIEGDNNGL